MSTSREIIMAFIKGTTWGTAVDADAAAAGMLVLDAGDFIEKPQMLKDESAGFAFPEYIDTGNVDVVVTPNMFLRADGSFLKLLAHAIGQDTAAQVGATADYDHTMVVQANPALFGTLVLNDGVASIREIPSFKTTGFTLSGQSGDFYTIQFTGRGDQVKTSSTTTTATSSVTYATKTLRFPFGATRFRVGDSDGNLGAGDQLDINSLTLDFQRNSVPDFVAQQVAEGAGENYTDEPKEDGMPTLTGSFSLPEYTAVGLIDNFTDETLKTMDIFLQGALTGEAGSQRYQYTIELPAVRLTNVTTTISNGQRIPIEVEFECMQAQSTPTGFTGSDMLTLVVRNQTTTDFDA